MAKILSIIIIAWAAVLIWVIPQVENLPVQLLGLAMVFAATQISSGNAGRAG